jgi:hypothetical protein
VYTFRPVMHVSSLNFVIASVAKQSPGSNEIVSLWRHGGATSRKTLLAMTI